MSRFQLPKMNLNNYLLLRHPCGSHGYQLVYTKQGLNQEVLKTLNDWIRLPNQRASALAKKLHWCTTHEGRDEKYQAVSSKLMDIKDRSTTIHLIQAQEASKTNNTSLCQRHLQLCLQQPPYDSDLDIWTIIGQTAPYLYL